PHFDAPRPETSSADTSGVGAPGLHLPNTYGGDAVTAHIEQTETSSRPGGNAPVQDSAEPQHEQESASSPAPVPAQPVTVHAEPGMTGQANTATDSNRVVWRYPSGSNGEFCVNVAVIWLEQGWHTE